MFTFKNKKPYLKIGKGLEQTFLQSRHTDGQQAQEKILTSLIIWEMQVQITLSYHLTPIRMAVVKVAESHRYW